MVSANCFANSVDNSESSPLYRLDNNWGFMYGNTVMSGYSSMLFGVDVHVLTDDNIWLEIENQDYSNLNIADTSENVRNNMSGFNISGKVGYAFILANKFAIIPNIGFGYLNLQDLVHSNSQPIFNYTLQSYNFSGGLNLEYAVLPTLKLELDNSLSFLSENPIVPSSTNTIGHDHEQNIALSATPSVSWNFYKQLNLSVFYQVNWMLTNNVPSFNINNSEYGLSSETLSKQLMSYPNILGIKFGMLF